MKADSKQLWTQVVIPQNSNIGRAIKVLNEIALKIVLVVNDKGVLLGTISDGDIRRGLLRGLDLTSPIDTVTHRDALVVPPELGQDIVVQLMTMNKIQQIPIVDQEKRVIGLHCWDEIHSISIRSNLMVIMAGGKGTRLQPQTENCPKPLLLVRGKPILEHIIDRAKIEGFNHFVLAIHYLGHMIEEYFGDGERFGVKIEYLREKLPLGTAGALSLLNPRPDTSFIVTNGDVITDIRYGKLLDFHQNQNAKATMAIRAHEIQNPFGVVETDGIEIIGYEEKPKTYSHINAGVYVLDPQALDLLNDSMPCDMPTLFESIKRVSGRIVAYPAHEDWLDVGSQIDLARADTEVGF
jgi:dTDP-glucose pyrophosphorylase